MYQSVQSAGTPLVPVVGKPVVSLENTAIYKIFRTVRAVSLVNRHVQTRVCEHGFEIENERFSVACSHFRQNLKFGDFTFSLCRGPQKYLLKSVLHVQHDYLSFNQ